METLPALRYRRDSRLSSEMSSIVSSKLISGILASISCKGNVPRTFDNVLMVSLVNLN